MKVKKKEKRKEGNIEWEKLEEMFRKRKVKERTEECYFWKFIQEVYFYIKKKNNVIFYNKIFQKSTNYSILIKFSLLIN